MSDGSFHSFTLVVRHGACLYFARDGLWVRYGKLVAVGALRQNSGCFSRTRDMDMRLLAFLVDSIKAELQLMDGGSWRPFWAVPYPDDYRTQSNTTKKQRRNKPYV